jgi:hypothetical protein
VVRSGYKTKKKSTRAAGFGSIGRNTSWQKSETKCSALFHHLCRSHAEKESAQEEVHFSSPATPPETGARIRRFGGLREHRMTMAGSPIASKWDWAAQGSETPSSRCASDRARCGRFVPPAGCPHHVCRIQGLQNSGNPIHPCFSTSTPLPPPPTEVGGGRCGSTRPRRQ